MTPQEKAKELVDKFMLVNSESVELETGEHELLLSLSQEDANQCALIHVEEMLEIASPNKLIYHYTEDGVTILEQWPERVFWWWVKQEIEKL